MKNYFLPALFWALALSHSFAQKTLPPSLKPYVDVWSYNMKRLFNHAGFDLPAAAVNKVSSRNPLQLDSTKTYNAYNLNAPGDSTPLFRSNYEYPSTDTKIETDLQFENGGWQKLSRTTLVSDNQQRLVEAVAEAYDPELQDFRLDSRFEVFPHGNSQELVDSFFAYLWDSTALSWQVILATRNTFDAQDRLLESTDLFDYFGTQLFFKDAYSYDANGDNYLIEQSALIDGVEFPSGRTDNVFVDHRILEATDYVSDGIDFYPANRTNYAYTTFGALRLAIYFEWNVEKDDWRVTQRVEYGFDDAQRIASKETTIYNQDAADERELVTYAYVQDENLSLEMTFNWDDDAFDFILDTKKHYYYNGLVSAPVVPQPALALQIVPNPAFDAIRLRLDNEALVHVFNQSGQLLQSRLVQPGQVLNVVDLPAGIYQVRAQQGGDYYIGKFVKQ